jgi:hypothetical protein
MPSMSMYRMLTKLRLAFQIMWASFIGQSIFKLLGFDHLEPETNCPAINVEYLCWCAIAPRKQSLGGQLQRRCRLWASKFCDESDVD